MPPITIILTLTAPKGFIIKTKPQAKMINATIIICHQSLYSLLRKSKATDNLLTESTSKKIPTTKGINEAKSFGFKTI